MRPTAATVARVVDRVPRLAKQLPAATLSGTAWPPSRIRPRLSNEIEGFAKALCGDDNDPLIFDQALVVAGNDLVLRSIHTQRIAVIERLRDIQAIALAKGNNSRKLAKGMIDRFDAPDFAEILVAAREGG